MAKTGIVKKPFPYGADGINIENLKIGDIRTFSDTAFDGLEAAGWIQLAAGEASPTAMDRDLNDRFILAFDRRLIAASDQELKDIIARSGQPWSGNLVHAEMVSAAKEQLVREAEGVEPVYGVVPNDGTTEQPLNGNEGASDSGKVPSADGDDTNANQPGPDLDALKKDELEQVAADRGVDITAARTKADIIAALKAAETK